jgi:hypothetical protein
MFVMYFSSKFQIFSFKDSLVIAIKLEAKGNIRKAIILFYILKKQK